MKTIAVGQRVRHVKSGVVGTYRGTWADVSGESNDVPFPHGVDFDSPICGETYYHDWWMADDEIEVVDDDNA